MSDTQLISSSPRRSNRHRGGSGRAPIALVVLLLIVGVLAAAGWYQFLRPENRVAAGKPVTVTIESGTSTEAIAHALVKMGVVSNSSMFRVRAWSSGAGSKLKAGEYKLSTGMPYDLVLKRLQRGPEIVTFVVLIPEGFTARQVAARFAKRAKMDEPTLLKLMTTGAKQFSAEHPYLKGAYGDSLEGFLFPATYTVKEGTTEVAAVEMMLSKFDQEIAQVDLTYAKSKNLTVADVVTIASILERETQLAKEYPLVASVIYNRLKIKMRLQLDSTVFYGLPPGTKVLKMSDLKNGDPHNTYSHSGLPAGPISNPGAKAIEAAAAPAATNYYYYVLTSKDGSQTFTNTYADFLKAVKVYKRVFNVK